MNYVINIDKRTIYFYLPKIDIVYKNPSKFTEVRIKKMIKCFADFKRRLSSDFDLFQGEVTTFVKLAHFSIFAERLKF